MADGFVRFFDQRALAEDYARRTGAAFSLPTLLLTRDELEARASARAALHTGRSGGAVDVEVGKETDFGLDLSTKTALGDARDEPV